jgi:arginyl-tRNA synthetase
MPKRRTRSARQRRTGSLSGHCVTSCSGLRETTGPYCQYAVVRIRSIFQKVLERAQEGEKSGATPSREDIAQVFKTGGASDDLWELTLLAGSLGARIEAAIKSQEPAFVAKYCFELAQNFNVFYHKHHILSEPDAGQKVVLLALCGLVEKQLIRALALLGIEAPEKM